MYSAGVCIYQPVLNNPRANRFGHPMTIHLQTAPIDPADLALLRRRVASRLRQLRLATHPRLSQTAAAAYLGLSESTGYRSVGQWESGEVIPSSAVRPQFRRYLWDALGLHTRPDEFAALWEEIAIAWDWPPLSEVDLRELRSDVLVTAAAATVGETTVAPPVVAVAEEPVVIARPVVVGNGAPRRAASPRLLLVGLLAGTLALLVLAVAAFMPNFIVANPLFGNNQPAPELLHANLGFEAAQELAPWAVVGDPTCARRVADAAAAYSGDHFLRIDATAAACNSLRYDLANPPALGATARFAVWARAAGPTTAVELVLWPGQRSDGEPIMGEKQFARFTVDDAAWRCLEVALPIAAPTVNLVRAEIYFDDAAQLDLDEASIHFDGQSACQGQTPRFTNASFETGARHLGWSFMAEDGCPWEVVTDRAGSHAGQRYLRIDRSAPQCTSLYQDVLSAPLPGVTYRARIWVRAAGDTPVQASWTLWALGDESTSSTRRIVATDQWRCVETALTAPLEAYDRLRAELYFDTPDAIFAVDDAWIATGDRSLCPPQELLLNSGFEASSAAPWQEIGRCLAPAQEGEAHSGAGFVRAQKTAECASIFQDVFAEIAPGDSAVFSIWLRAAGATPARGQLALRAIGDQTDTAETPFTLTDDRWVCLETMVTAQNDSVVHWRPEIYFSSEGALFDLDDAALTLGIEGACPQSQYALHRLDWLPGTVAYPGSGISGMMEIENLSETATAWPHVLRYWLAATRNGPPLVDEASGALTVPPLAANASSGPLYFDLALPPSLAAGKTYYLMVDTGAAALSGSQRRRALPLKLAPCSADSLFCDIPNGFWAQTEAEAWYTDGITSGCRSETQPYRDLPFCPQQTLSPDTMAIFLLRHLTDPAYRPAAPYRGIYADVPETHRRSSWIEALYDQIGAVERSNCPQVEGEVRFCPQAPLLRQDLLRYLAAGLDAAPDPSAAPHYVDLTDTSELDALASTLWALGILPDNDPACPDLGLGPRFCPDEPAQRIDAAVWMVRAFGE